MKRLTLVRHARSGHEDGYSIPDFDRPLSRRGKEDAPELGRRLAARGVAPDAVVTSPARRARETARNVARQLGCPVNAIREDGRVYDATGGTLLEVVRGLDDAWDHVLLVGHNPGLHDLVNTLGDRGLDALPACAAVCLHLAGGTWREVGPGSGILVFFDDPAKPRSPS
jgi:phosphohistidine phosphatase